MPATAEQRFAIAAARRTYEQALRDLRSAEVHADIFRGPDGAIEQVDPVLNPQLAAEIATLQPALDAATAAVDGAKAALDQACAAYDQAAADEPIFDNDNADPFLLLPVRLEAIYLDNNGAPELRIRVYPDDVHVDSHEPALTDGEQRLGEAYWHATRAAGDDQARRLAAWHALVDATGGARATWIRQALTPTNAPPAAPAFPPVEQRAEAWTRAAHTRLIPDHFVFSLYRDGELIWRRDGRQVTPDPLPVGIAPNPTEADAESDGLAFDPQSRWLIDFDDAVQRGMGIVAPLTSLDDRFDLLTVLGVSFKGSATGSQLVQEMLAAHAFSRGLTPLPVGTPTNNTPGSRSGWRSRERPPDPDTAAAWRTAYDAGSDQEAARLARALGVDGSAVLAGVCDPAGGDESLLARLHTLQVRRYAWSGALRPVKDQRPVSEPIADAWYKLATDHYQRFVRARGPLPPLRIGRQPYGVLPVSAIDLWRGDDVHPDVTRVVGSFYAAFAQHAERAPRIGEGPDQDAVLLDILNREANPRRVDEVFATLALTPDGWKPPAATVGAIPSTLSLAWIQPEAPPAADDPGDGPFSRIQPLPEDLSDTLREIVAGHPLSNIFVFLDQTVKKMRQTLIPPEPHQFGEQLAAVSGPVDQLKAPPTRSLFYEQALGHVNTLNNVCASGPDLPDRVAQRVAEGQEALKLLADYIAFEDDASPSLARFEQIFRETLQPLAQRVDAWVSSLATARLAGLRQQRPSGIHVGAYGWLTDVERADPNPSREGYVVTPSLQHATTAAVLRSGWQAHADRRSFAVDIQSARVRRALAMVEGVRQGQTVSALLGYQCERALHDMRLDRFVAGFRDAYPLAALVTPDVQDAKQAQVTIGARNVVDGQALRRDRARLGDDAALAAAAGAPLNGAAGALRRILGELDETFDALGDLLLAESVHHLVGGNPLRAGLAADAAGRGQDPPGEFDVLRTPRSGIGVTHHVGILLGGAPPAGWSDDRPLAHLEPGLEGWVRHRLGPAAGWGLGGAGWCALDLLIAPPERVRAAIAASGAVDEAALARLLLVAERLRAPLATAAPLTPAHLDAADPAPGGGYDLGELRARVAPWLAALREAAAPHPDLERLAALGIPTGQGGPGDVDRVAARLAAVSLEDPPAPPDSATHPTEADAWVSAVLGRAAALLHPVVKVVPRLTGALPAPPQPPPDDDVLAAWLQDMTLVRPRVAALDDATVAAETLAGSPVPALAVAQPAASPGAPRGPWVAVAQPVDGPRPQGSIALQRDAGASDDVRGLVIDSWTEVVPRAPGEHGPEEIIGVAFDFDRPGARSPQALLVAVPPDLDRGWCEEDLHGCLDEALLLARVRSLDLTDVPELRTVLPIPESLDS